MLKKLGNVLTEWNFDSAAFYQLTFLIQVNQGANANTAGGANKPFGQQSQDYSSNTGYTNVGGYGPYGAPLAGAGEGGTVETAYKSDVSGGGTGAFSYGSTNTGSSNPAANTGDTSSTVTGGWDQNMYSQYMQQYMQQYSAYQVSRFYNIHDTRMKFVGVKGGR